MGLEISPVLINTAVMIKIFTEYEATKGKHILYDFWGRTMVFTFHYESHYRITLYAFYWELEYMKSLLYSTIK